jgi:hypothetical protein
MSHHEHFRHGSDFGFGFAIAEPSPLYLDSYNSFNQYGNPWNNGWNNGWNTGCNSGWNDSSWNCQPPEYINMTPAPYYPIATPPFMPIGRPIMPYYPRPFFGIGGRNFSIGISI